MGARAEIDTRPHVPRFIERSFLQSAIARPCRHSGCNASPFAATRSSHAAGLELRIVDKRVDNYELAFAAPFRCFAERHATNADASEPTI
jgi:hypothetical protein